jgi:hypothetical protein
MAGWERAPGEAIIGPDGHDEEETMRTRMGKMARWFELATLGAVMSLMARLVERRLLRAVGRRQQ